MAEVFIKNTDNISNYTRFNKLYQVHTKYYPKFSSCSIEIKETL
jgi:hypothetical protein